MAFQVEEAAYELIAALRAVVMRVRSRDRSLADQLTRAASSVALNIAESNYSDAGNRRARLFTAAGSANETRAATWCLLASGVGPGFAPPSARSVTRPHRRKP